MTEDILELISAQQDTIDSLTARLGTAEQMIHLLSDIADIHSKRIAEAMGGIETLSAKELKRANLGTRYDVDAALKRLTP